MDGMTDTGVTGGLLDPNYMEKLKAMMDQMGPSSADQQTAKFHSILAAGLGMLANSYKPPSMALGIGGGIGMQNYNDELTRLGAQRTQNMSNLGALDTLQQNMGARQAMMDMYKQNGMPGATPAPPAAVGMGPPDASGDTSQQAPPSGIAPLGSASGGMATKAQMAESYQRYGMGMAARGFPDQATKYFDIAEKMRPVFDKTETLTDPNTNQRTVLTRFKDGTYSVMPYAPDAPDLSFHDTGTVLQPFDPKTGLPQGQGTPLSPSIPQAETARHNRATEGTPEDVAAVSGAIGRGQLDPLSGNAMRSGPGLKVMANVVNNNPQYSTIDYEVGQKARQAFTTGSQGDTVRSISVANNHIGTLMPLIDAIDNKSLQVSNKVANWYKTQTGQAAPTDLNGVKSIVADEVVKAVVGGASALGDREKIDAAFNNVNSPAQLKSLVQKYQLLMGGQLEGLQRQYKAGTGRDDFSKLLSTESQAQMPHSGAALVPVSRYPQGVMVPIPGGGFKDFTNQAKADQFKAAAGLQ